MGVDAIKTINDARTYFNEKGHIEGCRSPLTILYEVHAVM